jgi:hypothetical protein
MQDVPAVWDEVKFLDGYPGKFYAVARRAGKKWYVRGSMLIPFNTKSN